MSELWSVGSTGNTMRTALNKYAGDVKRTKTVVVGVEGQDYGENAVDILIPKFSTSPADVNDAIKSIGSSIGKSPIGGEIHFLEGLYIFNAPIEIPDYTYGVKLSGVGWGTHIYNATGFTSNSMTGTLVIKGACNVEIENIRFSAPGGTDANAKYKNGICISGDKWEYVHIHNCHFDKITGSCIAIGTDSAATSSKVRDLRITDNTMTDFNFSGIYVRNALKGVSICGNYIKGKSDNYSGNNAMHINMANDSDSFVNAIISQNFLYGDAYSIIVENGSFSNYILTDNFISPSFSGNAGSVANNRTPNE